MATNSTAGSSSDLFQRKATGLLRGWSAWDGFIYATFSINLITLGLFIFSYAPFLPDGSLPFAIILSGLYLIFQAVTYAALIAVMPRAGGDYVWTSRVLGGGVGFVMAVTGWWFILWHWVPIYADIMNKEFFVPLAAILDFDGAVTFFSGSTGLFVASMFVALLASLYISLGMRAYARIQKFCFYGGLVGLAVMIGVLIVSSNSEFVSAYNQGARDLFGASGNAYQQTLQAGSVETSSAFYPTLLLLPMLAFFNLFSNWGATLYGEVRGASDFRKNIYAMGGALVFTSVLAVVLLILFARTFGWDFYYAANNAFWAGEGPVSAWPYPGMLAAMLFESPLLQAILVALMSLWFFGWVGTVFLSSTRVVFAVAFDRVLPEWASKTSNNGVPYAALLLMLIPAIPVSYMYAFGSVFGVSFDTFVLDAVLVIALTFLGSTVAAAILPWRKPAIYNASPIARYNILGVPLITAAAVAFGGFLIFCLYLWILDPQGAYGVNHPASMLYMAGLYLVAFAIYVGFRIYRRRQGIDLKMVYDEIPED